MERDMNQSAAASIPTLCRSGCGFYGSSASEGLCSKCFKDALKRKQDPARHSAGPVTPTPSPVPVPMPVSVPAPSTSVTSSALTTGNDSVESSSSMSCCTSALLNNPGDVLNNKMCATSHFIEETRDNCAATTAATTIAVTGAPSPTTTNDIIFEHSSTATGANDIPPTPPPKAETSATSSSFAFAPVADGHRATTATKSRDELATPPQHALTATTSAADVTGQKTGEGGDEDQSVSSATAYADSGDLHKSSSFPSQKPNRCYQCNKKVGFTGFDCRCGFIFCGVHRYSDMHNCSFDYKSMGADEIRKANPVVKNEKIQKL